MSDPTQPDPPGTDPLAAPATRAGARLVLAVILVLALIGSAVVLLASRGSDDSPSSEVVLEAASSPGADPYTDDLAGEPADAALLAATAPPFERPAADVTADPVPMAATEPGLYGGTREVGRCDAAQLVSFLADDGSKAAAWADVHEIAPDAIESFVAGLTPVVLRTDTQVTNHGFRDGAPTSFQAVLEAGTAVLVDSNGVPRVKCNCGNPLLAARPTAAPDYTGAPWAGFDANRIASPQPAAPVDRFVLVDPAVGAPFVRAVGTDGSNDLDAPAGTDVSDPIGRAIVANAEAGTAERGDPADGPGSIRFAPGGKAALGGAGVRIANSTLDLTFSEDGGPVSGPFSVTLRVRADGCATRATVAGNFDGTADGAALTGTWAGSAALEPAAGCVGDEIVSGAVGGDWAAIFDPAARMVSGSMSLTGVGLFDFELQTGRGG